MTFHIYGATARIGDRGDATGNTLGIYFSGKDGKGDPRDALVELNGQEIVSIKEQLGEVRRFNFCPWCGEALTTPTDKDSPLLPNGDWDLNDGAPLGPPCGGCRYWSPKYLFGDLICCTEYRRMRPEFSCYRPKGGTE